MYQADSGLPVIAVAGVASVDMTVYDALPDWAGSTGGDSYLAAPIRALNKPVRMHLGGNGGAAAYIMGRLGAYVQLNAPIGQDAPGTIVRGWLTDAGVDIVAQPAPSTMFALTFAVKDGGRLGTLQYRGSSVDWQLSVETAAKWLLAAINSEVTPEDFANVYDTLVGFSGTVVLDSGIGWMRDIPPAQIHAMWRHVDLLSGTVEELAHWTQCQEPRAIARSVLQHGPRAVVIKCGPEGAAWQEAGGAYYHQPAVTVAKRDVSIGAGDGFNGALIALLARNESMEKAVAGAQQVAAKVVETGSGVMGWQSGHEMGEREQRGNRSEIIT